MSSMAEVRQHCHRCNRETLHSAMGGYPVCITCGTATSQRIVRSDTTRSECPGCNRTSAYTTAPGFVACDCCGWSGSVEQAKSMLGKSSKASIEQQARAAFEEDRRRGDHRGSKSKSYGKEDKLKVVRLSTLTPLDRDAWRRICDPNIEVIRVRGLQASQDEIREACIELLEEWTQSA